MVYRICKSCSDKFGNISNWKKHHVRECHNKTNHEPELLKQDEVPINFTQRGMEKSQRAGQVKSKISGCLANKATSHAATVKKFADQINLVTQGSIKEPHKQKSNDKEYEDKLQQAILESAKHEEQRKHCCHCNALISYASGRAPLASPSRIQRPP